jgi:hypothetical protein
LNLQNCQKICKYSGKYFCRFDDKNGQTSYAGCLPEKYIWYCCNKPTKNHKGCVLTNTYPHKFYGPCDAENYGDWLFMRNTKGHATCRQQDELVSGGVQGQFRK